MRSNRPIGDGLVLGTRISDKGVPAADQRRQRDEADEILRRLERQPGVILADEVGMGKTFVALAVAVRTALRNPIGPVIVMAPTTLVPKWEQDLKTFCEQYMEDRRPVKVGEASPAELRAEVGLRYATANDGVALFRLLDDPPRSRAHLVFVTHGAMSRQRMDKWVNLALVAEALRRHARGRNRELIRVREVIHRFLAELLQMSGHASRHELGDQLWTQLLGSPPAQWREIYNRGVRSEVKQLRDDPVPRKILRTIDRTDLRELADTLRAMPVRARGGAERVTQRIASVRKALLAVEHRLWKELLAQANWRSPLLVMDEAHHLKNAGTQLARQLQSAESIESLQAGEGAMANSFDRMLFLTATPFQLGHQELVRVLERFGDIRWRRASVGERSTFMESLGQLHRALDESQRTSRKLHEAWSHLRAEELPASPDDLEAWWTRIRSATDGLTSRQRALLEAYDAALLRRRQANELLRPLVMRHNKGTHWSGSPILRRVRHEGAAILDGDAASGAGIEVPAEQLLPFFLAARSAVNPHKDLLGDALCSSYEAFRHTRAHREHPEDFEQHAESNPQAKQASDDTRMHLRREVDALLTDRWYLEQFDAALERQSAAVHPKLAATVHRAADLWEQGEKIVVFAFYRETCRALRSHISNEIERRLLAKARFRLGLPDGPQVRRQVEWRLQQIQDRYFDKPKAPGKRAMDAALDALVQLHAKGIDALDQPAELRAGLISVMRRFLRVQTTLVRCYPFEIERELQHAEIASRLLDHADASGMTWRQKFDEFIGFLLGRCSRDDRAEYLAALGRISTGAQRVGEDGDAEDDGDIEGDGNLGIAGRDPRTPSKTALANIALCIGATKLESRLRRMRGFNTPFFPDILVCSEVMSEGVDLQRFCRHVIHHDLAWNPSTIEQRTGRVDRIGCKAMNRHPIQTYLPYIGGGADERQFRVMRDRERWFQVVMGQDAVANLINAETVDRFFPLPASLVDSLAFDLGIRAR